MSESTDTSVTVIGAGIIGICSACYLQRSGFQVTLIDREEPAMQTSFGNAGGISPGSVAPIGMPGMWQQIPRWLIDDKSPLFIKARHFPKVLPWLMRFISQSRRSRVLEISKALTALNGPTFAAYQPLLEEAGITGLFHKTGSCSFTTRGRTWKKIPSPGSFAAPAAPVSSTWIRSPYRKSNLPWHQSLKQDI